MNFQYFETLLDKSEKNLFYFVENIIPAFTKGELPILLRDLEGRSLTKKEQSDSKLVKGFLEVGEDYDTVADLSKLNFEQLKLLYKIFISKEMNDKKAVKWRLYQNIKFIRDFTVTSIQVNRTNDEEEYLDFIIRMENKELYFVVCWDVLELDNYMQIINNIIEFEKKNNISPDKLIIATSKTYRNIPITEAFTLKDKSIIPELWVEWVDLEKAFNGDDLITMITNKNEKLELAGFNFSSTSELLDYVYEYSGGGQISLFKQIGYFSETIEEEQQVELIWKGIMIKT